MSGRAYYNEIDPYAAQWLRNLISAGHIAPGEVDTRSIEDVCPVDLMGFTQCHFFAGIGVWSAALRAAGWADDRPVWTGSCPCQPFSAAGKGGGFADERHLWPAFHHLIRECRPGVVFGEQVASKDGLAWLDLVHTDLEASGYASAALDLCAAGVGAPHIRQRLYWVAHADHERCTGIDALLRQGDGRERGAEAILEASRCGVAGGMADANGRQRHRLADGEGCQPNGTPARWEQGNRESECRGAVGGFWRDAEWITCLDQKARPVEPGTFPLAHGAAARVGRLRAYGNAIVAPLAQEFIQAVMECVP